MRRNPISFLSSAEIFNSITPYLLIVLKRDPGLDWRIILRWIFKKWDVGYGLDRAGSVLGQVAGTFECDNENTGFIKYWEFLD